MKRRKHMENAIANIPFVTVYATEYGLVEIPPDLAARIRWKTVAWMPPSSESDDPRELRVFDDQHPGTQEVVAWAERQALQRFLQES